MRLIRKCRIHDAVLWRKLGDSGRGFYVYDKPVQIKCRWNQADEQMFTKEGSEFRCISDLIVDRDMAVGDLLLYGKLEDVGYDVTQPLVIPNIGVVRKVEKLTTLRNADITNFDLTACFVYLGQI